MHGRAAMTPDPNIDFPDAVRGLLAGDFSRLDPLFDSSGGEGPPAMIRWHEAGRFDAEPRALAEAFSCACFNGRTRAVEYFLSRGVGPSGGDATGLNAFHWAANRGQLAVVEILVRHKASLETKNAHGGTVLGCAVWSALHEPRPDHVRIIEVLLRAGADARAAEYPTGDRRVDEVLRRYRPSS